MANYLRQLRNDEKRATCVLVGTFDNTVDKDVGTTLEFNLLSIPEQAIPLRSYILVTEPFPVGSTLDIEVAEGDAAGEIWGAITDLVTVGVIEGLATDRGAIYKRDNIVNVTLNQVALDGSIGKFKVVLEYTEPLITIGKYTT